MKDLEHIYSLLEGMILKGAKRATQNTIVISATPDSASHSQQYARS